jgi:hypothetical protein
METTSYSRMPDAINWERVARTETHLLRVSILDLLSIDGGRTLSPSELAFELQDDLAKVTYHATELRNSELIVLVHEHEIGGSIEHFYSLPGRSYADLLERLKLWHKDP